MRPGQLFLLIAGLLASPIPVWAEEESSPAPAAEAEQAPAAEAPAPAGDMDPAAAEALLKEKGLARSGDSYALPTERDLATGLAELRVLKKKSDDAQKSQAVLEKRIRMAKGMIANGELEMRKLNEEVAKTPSGAKQNQLIGKMNALGLQIKEAVDYKTQAEAEINKTTSATRNEYVEALVKLTSKTEDTASKYEQLAADEKVQNALASLNAAGKKVKLGPTAPFNANRKVLEKMSGEVLTEDIPIDNSEGVPMVSVVLNGTHTREMIVDSGASIVCLPADMASDLGLKPTDANPLMRMQLADGKVVEGRLMILASVQVGKFRVNHVECAVLPPELIAAQPLLGGSFLSNFTYKIDPNTNKLHLVQIGDDNLAPAKPEAKPEAKPDKAE